MRIIEVKPHRGGWKVLEAPGVEPFYLGPNAKEQAISYATERLKFSGGKVRILGRGRRYRERDERLKRWRAGLEVTPTREILGCTMLASAVQIRRNGRLSDASFYTFPALANSPV